MFRGVKDFKVGQTIDKLTIVDFEKISRNNPKDRRKDLVAICVCVCGSKKQYRLYKLSTIGSKDCGCSKVKIEVGMVFRELTVIEIFFKKNKKGYNDRYVKCRCICGKTKNISWYVLPKRKPRFDGCNCGWKNGSRSGRWKGVGEIPSRYLSRILYQANLKGRNYDVLDEELWDLFLKQERKCAISGVDLQFFGEDGLVKQTASLDRIDSNKGYEISNVQWIHKIVQFMKQELPDDVFIEWCHTISKNQLNKE